MDKDPGSIDTPSLAEKAELYVKAHELLDSEAATVVKYDEREDGSDIHAILLEKEVQPDGEVHRLGYDIVRVQRREAFMRRGTTFPEKTTVSAYRWVAREGMTASEAIHSVIYEMYMYDDGPEILPWQEPKGIIIPDDLSPPTPITKEQGLELRQILSAFAKEV